MGLVGRVSKGQSLVSIGGLGVVGSMNSFKNNLHARIWLLINKCYFEPNIFTIRYESIKKSSPMSGPNFKMLILMSIMHEE